MSEYYCLNCTLGFDEEEMEVINDICPNCGWIIEDIEDEK